MRGSRLIRALVAATAMAGAACETVDLGQPPSDINTCRPSQQFFIDEIWPNVLYKDYPSGQHCWDSACHGAAAPNPLDLTVPLGAGTIPLMNEWATNYMSVTEEMNCSNVAASRLIEYPAAIRSHGGLKQFEPDGDEVMLIKRWISQP